MHSPELFKTVFNTDPSDPGNREMLLDITEKYPYFTLAHYFLLRNSNTTDTGYEHIAAKTALLFGNPYLLNYRLNLVETQPEIPGKLELPAAEAMPETKPGDEMLFEPLFASDYFASQGIKLSEEVLTGDKLGKQLKSFTDWLKTMKKVHETKITGGNEQIDLQVQRLAEKSNQEDDILTESMAEAYLQQGKANKAKAVFQKLSLLNPAKSAYFAAKIEKITEG